MGCLCTEKMMRWSCMIPHTKHLSQILHFQEASMQSRAQRNVRSSSVPFLRQRDSQVHVSPIQLFRKTLCLRHQMAENWACTICGTEDSVQSSTEHRISFSMLELRYSQKRAWKSVRRISDIIVKMRVWSLKHLKKNLIYRRRELTIHLVRVPEGNGVLGVLWLSPWKCSDCLEHRESWFGENGKNYFRLTSFGKHEKTKEAMERFNSIILRYKVNGLRA